MESTLPTVAQPVNIDTCDIPHTIPRLNEIKLEYLRDKKTTIRGLAKKYNVKHHALRWRYEQDDWQTLRFKYSLEVTQKTLSKLTTIDSEKIIKNASRTIAEEGILQELTDVIRNPKAKVHHKIQVTQDALEREGYKAPDKIEIEMGRMQAFRERMRQPLPPGRHCLSLDVPDAPVDKSNETKGDVVVDP